MVGIEVEVFEGWVGGVGGVGGVCGGEDVGG